MSSFKKIGDLICDLFGISLTEEPSQEETKYIPYLNLHIMESPYNDVDIQCIEQEIMKLNASPASIDKEQVKTLLRLRKSMLDQRACAHEKEFLPAITEFNLAVERALKDLYDLAHRYYEYMAAYDSGIQLVARLQFTNACPHHHPLLSSGKSGIWKSLLEHGWNPLFQLGLTEIPLHFPYDIKKSFPLFAGTYEKTQLAYWRGGGFFEDAQDDEMKEYHFNSVFYHLAEHTCFALTDFIYVRDFDTSIEIHSGEQKSYSRLLD